VTGGINVTNFDAAAQQAKLTGQIRSFLDWLVFVRGNDRINQLGPTVRYRGRRR
jgi:hypothetical protein